MGLTIHYSGTLKNPADLQALVQEVKDISESLDWDYQVLTTDELSGIITRPNGSEPVWLTFFPTGRLCSPGSVMPKEWYKANDLDPELMYTAFTKTQYAGMDAHISVIKLLRYLKEKYFAHFELRDEGYYWETNSEEKLKAQFDAYNQALEIMTGILDNMERRPGESAESLSDRIEKLLQEKLDKRNTGN